MNTLFPVVSAEPSKAEQLRRMFKEGFSDMTYDEVMALSNLFAHAVFSRLKELRQQDTPAHSAQKPANAETLQCEQDRPKRHN